MAAKPPLLLLALAAGAGPAFGQADPAANVHREMDRLVLAEARQLAAQQPPASPAPSSSAPPPAPMAPNSGPVLKLDAVVVRERPRITLPNPPPANPVLYFLQTGDIDLFPVGGTEVGIYVMPVADQHPGGDRTSQILRSFRLGLRLRPKPKTQP